MIEPGEMNLDELRAALAPLIPAHAVFDGWSDKALDMAAAELGVPANRARLAFPGGAPQMIDGWFDAIDIAMARSYPLERIAKMKIRERIRDLVLFRLETVNPHKEALRRALAILAQPQNAALGVRLAWRASWARLAGTPSSAAAMSSAFSLQPSNTALAGIKGASAARSSSRFISPGSIIAFSHDPRARSMQPAPAAGSESERRRSSARRDRR